MTEAAGVYNGFHNLIHVTEYIVRGGGGSL